MTFPSKYYLFLFLLFVVYASKAIESAETTFNPKRIVLPITKDPITKQFVIEINHGTPLVPIKLTLDLDGESLWLDCEKDYLSSTYKPARCGSAACSLAKSESCNSNNTCSSLAHNTVTDEAASGEVGQDVVSVRAIDGSNFSRYVSIPDFMFTCVPTNLRDGLADGVQGMAGLGRSPTSLPSLFASAFGIENKFVLFLRNGDIGGFVSFGDDSNMNLSNPMFTTPLIRNRAATSDYYIGVTNIKINGHTVPFNKTLLNIDKSGNGGTTISTVNPYTIMETSIYEAVVNAFDNELDDEVPRVEAVAPFTACYNSTYISSSIQFPRIDLVLQSSDVVWKNFEANSMVKVAEDVVCLGFVDGGHYEQQQSNDIFSQNKLEFGDFVHGLSIAFPGAEAFVEGVTQFANAVVEVASNAWSYVTSWF